MYRCGANRRVPVGTCNVLSECLISYPEKNGMCLCRLVKVVSNYSRTATILELWHSLMEVTIVLLSKPQHVNDLILG